MLLSCTSLIDASLPYHEKAKVPLSFGQIRTRLEVEYFPSFPATFGFFPRKFAACSKPPSRDNHCKASYPRTQQRDQGAGRAQDHVIMVVVKTTPLPSLPCCRQFAQHAAQARYFSSKKSWTLDLRPHPLANSWSGACSWGWRFLKNVLCVKLRRHLNTAAVDERVLGVKFPISGTGRGDHG